MTHRFRGAGMTFPPVIGLAALLSAVLEGCDPNETDDDDCPDRFHHTVGVSSANADAAQLEDGTRDQLWS